MRTIILSALLLSACSQRERCIRAYAKCGPLWRTDTLEFFDSVAIELNTTDTVLSYQTMRFYDTVTIRDGRAMVRIVRLPGDSIYVQGECGDTVIRYVTQRVNVAGPEKPWPWWLWIAAAGLFLGGYHFARRR